MNVLTAAAVLALLGSGIIGGIFYAFSSFIMRALARVTAQEGIAAMQSINIVVLSPSFLSVFMGTAVISVLVATLAAKGWGEPSAPWYLGGALLYVIGTFLLTGLGNVPLNDKLAGVSSTDPVAVKVWEHYLKRWTMLNTVRTAAALAATSAFASGLIHGG